MNTNRTFTRLTLLQRAGRAIIALLFLFWHSYMALLVLGEAMVNASPQANTRHAQILQVTLGGAVICSLAMVVGSVVGSQRRLLLLFGVLLVFCWIMAFWLV